MPSSRLSSKGQVTIPLEVRTRLGLRTGDRVDFVFEGDKTVLRPARHHTNAFQQYVGALPYFKTIDEINAWVRELRGDESEGQ